jgi:hypothetical protein
MTTTINADNGVSSGSAGLKSSADSSGVLALQTNGTTAVTVGTDQAVTMAGRTTNPTTISVGAATPSTSGAGITFPATQSASTDVNTLDDYEEGTWTPQLAAISASFSVNPTYTSQTGTYTKIGRFVYCAFSFALSSKGTAASAYPGIANLPFASSKSNTVGCFYFDSLAVSWIWVGLQTRTALTNGYFVGSKAAATAASYFATSLTDLTNTSYFEGIFVYEV